MRLRKYQDAGFFTPSNNFKTVFEPYTDEAYKKQLEQKAAKDLEAYNKKQFEQSFKIGNYQPPSIVTNYQDDFTPVVEPVIQNNTNQLLNNSTSPEYLKAMNQKIKGEDYDQPGFNPSPKLKTKRGFSEENFNRVNAANSLFQILAAGTENERKQASFLESLNNINPTFSKAQNDYGQMEEGGEYIDKNSVVDTLKYKNKDSSFANRKMLAKKYHIPNYRGTAPQNIELLKYINAPLPQTVLPNRDVSFENNTRDLGEMPLKPQPVKSYKGSPVYHSNGDLIGYSNDGDFQTYDNPALKPETQRWMQDENNINNFMKSKIGDYYKGIKKYQDGGSIVDTLKAKGQDSSFEARKKLAQEHNIKDYKGTLEQNIELLKKVNNVDFVDVVGFSRDEKGMFIPNMGKVLDKEVITPKKKVNNTYLPKEKTPITNTPAPIPNIYSPKPNYTDYSMNLPTEKNPAPPSPNIKKFLDSQNFRKMYLSKYY